MPLVPVSCDTAQAMADVIPVISSGDDCNTGQAMADVIPVISSGDDCNTAQAKAHNYVIPV